MSACASCELNEDMQSSQCGAWRTVGMEINCRCPLLFVDVVIREGFSEKMGRRFWNQASTQENEPSREGARLEQKPVHRSGDAGLCAEVGSAAGLAGEGLGVTHPK